MATATLTDLEQLEAAQARIVSLEADLKAANQLNEEASTNAGTLSAENTTLKATVASLEGRNAALAEQLAAANAKVTTLEADAKNTTQRAVEIAAANGVTAVAKSDEGTGNASSNGDAAIYDAFKKADPVASHEMLKNPVKTAAIRRESARRMALHPAA